MPCALGRGKPCGMFHSYNAVFGLILPPLFWRSEKNIREKNAFI